METNKVNVKIYGQEYVIAGDKPREEIIQVAAHVDMKMQEIGEAAINRVPRQMILGAVEERSLSGHHLPILQFFLLSILQVNILRSLKRSRS